MTVTWRKRAAVLLGLILPLNALAQAPIQAPATSPSPFDLSAAKAAMGDVVPTVPAVATLEQQALAAFQGGDWKTAVDALDRYAKAANGLSNYIAQGQKPYYTASFDDRKLVPPAQLAKLVPLERLGNDYKEKRNRAMVMEAECLVKLNDTSKAASMYYQALGLIDVKDTEWWDRARNGLNALLQVK